MAEGVRRRRKEQQEQQQQQQQQVNGFKHEQEEALLDEFSSGSEDDGPATLPQNHHLESGLRQAWSSSAKEWAAVVCSPRNVVTLVYALSYTLSIPVLPFMARRHLYGYRDEFVGPDGKVMIDESPGIPEAWRGIGYGCVMSGYYATKMIAAPLIGFLSDRVGRKMLLVVTFLGSCVTFTLTCLMGRHSLHGLVLCRLLLGCFAANGALMMAYIRDSVPREAQASAFAQHSAAWGMAYVVATPLLAALREDPVRCLVLAAVCMALAALLVALFFQDMSLEDRERIRTYSGAADSKPSSMRSVGGDREGEGARGGGDGERVCIPRKRKRRHIRAMVRVFRSMLQERLVLCIFALQVIRPAQDLAPLVTSKFGAGAAFVASITSVRSTFRMLLPLTPVIPMLHAALGGGTRDPKTGEVVGGDRPVAAVMCVAMALLGALVPLCPNLVVLQVVMAAKGLANVIKESTVSAIMSSLASHGNVGAFFGWQHFMKGLAGVTSHMVTGLLVSRGPEHPYFATAACDLLYALIYVFA